MLNLPQVPHRFELDLGFFPASPSHRLGRLAVFSQIAPEVSVENLLLLMNWDTQLHAERTTRVLRFL